MKDFAALFTRLDSTNKTSEKVRHIRNYFLQATSADAAWCVYFLTGRKIRQLVPTARLTELAIQQAAISPWLFQESYDAVGDLAETISLLLPAPKHQSKESLTQWVEERLIPLRDLPEAEQKNSLLQCWNQLNDAERFVMTKLITGAFRVGVSQQLVIKALASVSGLDEASVAHRLMGQWSPTAQFYDKLIQPNVTDTLISRPYPFYLAYPLASVPESLGDISDWIAEWKWDGIRSQLIKRKGEVFIWSRGEELITDRFPELAAAAALLPDGTVLDGEILGWKDDSVMLFNSLQTRIARKTLSKKLLADVPAALMAYDLLELAGEDLRDQPISIRREKLQELLAVAPAQSPSQPSVSAVSAALLLSPLVQAESWRQLADIRENSRKQRVEGLMLKRKQSVYGVGRRKADWWKWKVNPFTVDAVLIYAQRGQGKRASLYTDYTFGVWHESKLVPVAKAYSGLTDEEIKEVDAFVRKNTLEKFGPVRTVRPELVFELAFEGIQKSTRHKSGVAVRFPRIVRWRTDKPVEEADSLDTLSTLIETLK